MPVVWSEPFFMTNERTRVIENKAFNLPCLTETDVGQGCQIFLGKTYQNGGKYTKSPQTIPNGRKYSKWLTNIFHSKALHIPKLGFRV
jgi:hypothetical protein